MIKWATGCASLLGKVTWPNSLVRWGFSYTPKIARRWRLCSTWGHRLCSAIGQGHWLGSLPGCGRRLSSEIGLGCIIDFAAGWGYRLALWLFCPVENEFFNFLIIEVFFPKSIEMTMWFLYFQFVNRVIYID